MHFTKMDVSFFNQSEYDLILFVGDLSNYQPRAGLTTARQIAQLKKPALFIPGNHDAVNILQLAAEIWQKPWLARIGAWGQVRRVRTLRKALGTAVFTGYSSHHFNIKGQAFDVVTGRPFSMGGPFLSFKPHLQRRHTIATLDDSVAKLQQCVNQTQSDRLIFLAHNGPAGLSRAATDIWGCDFKPEAGDFGDPDLEKAIAYAKSRGKQVLAVIAGHLHHRTKDGAARQWLVKQDETFYVNAARVPRIFESGGRTVHHHVQLAVGDTAVTVTEILV